MKKQKKVLLITILSVIALVGIVYAAFTAITLQINTSATASASIFSVGFDDVNSDVIYKSNDNITVNATKQASDSINLSVTGLKNPGDVARVKFEITNDGDVDASEVKLKIGAEEELESRPYGNSYVTEDGLFAFTIISNTAEGSSGQKLWEPASGFEIKSGETVPIGIEVELLKRVDVETNGACTVNLTAIPGNLELSND